MITIQKSVSGKYWDIMFKEEPIARRDTKYEAEALAREYRLTYIKMTKTRAPVKGLGKR